MELFEETVFNGNALVNCLSYLEKKGIELVDYSVRVYSPIGMCDYYMIHDHCGEEDMLCPTLSTYSRIHLFVVEEDEVVGYFNGFWVNLNNFIMHEDFFLYLSSTCPELFRKASLYRKTVFPELPPIRTDKRSFETQSKKVELETVKHLEEDLLIDTTDQYVFIGDKYEFIDTDEVLNKVLTTRTILSRFIRMNLDIESETPEMKEYVEHSRKGVWKALDTEEGGFYYKLDKRLEEQENS